MVGILQPLSQQFKIANPDGTPTDYFIRWAQERQIDITNGINAQQAQALIDAWAAQRDVIAGTGLTGGGNLSTDITLNADVQAILNLITTTRGSILYRGASSWSALAPGTSGQVLSTNGAGADPSWIAAGGGGGGGNIQDEAKFNYPNLTTWPTWFQQGTSTVTADAIGSTVTWQGGVNIRSLVKAAPGSTPYNVYARMSWANGSGTMHAGLCLRQSSNNWHVGLNIIPTSSLFVQSYNGNTFNANHGSMGSVDGFNPLWFRLQVNSATSIDAFVSKDGIGWYPVVTGINVSGFMTPDSIGIWMRCDTGTPVCRVSYFDTIAPTV